MVADTWPRQPEWRSVGAAPSWQGDGSPSAVAAGRPESSEHRGRNGPLHSHGACLADQGVGVLHVSPIAAGPPTAQGSQVQQPGSCMHTTTEPHCTMGIRRPVQGLLAGQQQVLQPLLSTLAPVLLPIGLQYLASGLIQRSPGRFAPAAGTRLDAVWCWHQQRGPARRAAVCGVRARGACMRRPPTSMAEDCRSARQAQIPPVLQGSQVRQAGRHCSGTIRRHNGSCVAAARPHHLSAAAAKTPPRRAATRLTRCPLLLLPCSSCPAASAPCPAPALPPPSCTCYTGVAPLSLRRSA